MTPPRPATRHVVERCPRCGVQHDVSADAVCEACHAPLRPWCSRHGRETGWLDGPGCPRCAEEAARPAPRPRAPSLPCPAPAMPARVEVGATPPAVAEEASRPMPVGTAQHAVVLILMMLTGAGGGAMLGVIAGFLYVLSGRGELSDTPLRFAVSGATVGALFVAVSGVHYLRTLRNPPPAP